MDDYIRDELLHQARLHFRYDEFLQLAPSERINDKLNGERTTLHNFLALWVLPKDPVADLIGRKRVIKQLLDWKANINARDHNDETPLWYATENHDYDIFPFLLANGAYFRISPAICPFSLPEIIVSNDDQVEFPMVKLLMMYGANPNDFQEESGSYNDAMHAFYNGILKARKATIAFVRLTKKATLLKFIGKDITLLIAKIIYQTRGEPKWNRDGKTI